MEARGKREAKRTRRPWLQGIFLQRALKVRDIHRNYCALSELHGYFVVVPGATRFALAPGFHISRRWRSPFPHSALKSLSRRWRSPCQHSALKSLSRRWRSPCQHSAVKSLSRRWRSPFPHSALKSLSAFGGQGATADTNHLPRRKLRSQTNVTSHDSCQPSSESLCA